MNYNDLPGNSYKSREEKRQNSERKGPVIDTTPEKHDDTFMDIMFNGFVNNLENGFFPAVKKGAYDTAVGILNNIFNGFGPTAYRSPQRTNYSNPIRTSPAPSQKPQQFNTDWTNIYIKSKPDFDNLMQSLYDSLDDDGTVSLLDLYDNTGITTKPGDNYLGWTEASLSRFTIESAGYPLSGYILKAPRPMRFD